MGETEKIAHHRKRQRAERRFALIARSALGLALLALIILLGSIFFRGISGFKRAEIQLSVPVSAELLGLEEGETVQDATASAFLRPVQEALRARFPEVTERTQQRDLYALLSTGAAAELRGAILASPDIMDKNALLWLPASSLVDMALKKRNNTQKTGRALSADQQGWLSQLQRDGATRVVFNTAFFTEADSRQPERAGFLGAMAGSLLTMLVCLALAFPIGVMTAVYLEEFARKSTLVDIIEVNINNLAAVPSIVFGLLGLSVYLNFMHLPRSSAVVGGLTLALMILPVIIIATRSSLRAVPDSIRDAARALGATPLQVVWHHSLPLAMPGVMTGTILGLARAIGETAPLLMIGMVAFVADIPRGFTDPATVMPVQIFLWASSPEAGYVEKTAAGIMLLLILLLSMNALAIYIRRRFEVRW